MNEVKYSTSIDEVRLADVELNGYKNWFDRYVIGAPTPKALESLNDSNALLTWNEKYIEYRVTSQNNVSDQCNVFFDWADVMQIKATENYILIGGAETGFFIPKRVFNDGGTSFLSQLKAFKPDLEF